MPGDQPAELVGTGRYGMELAGTGRTQPTEMAGTEELLQLERAGQNMPKHTWPLWELSRCHQWELSAAGHLFEANLKAACRPKIC